MQLPKMLLDLEKQLKNATEHKYKLDVGWFDKENVQKAITTEYGEIKDFDGRQAVIPPRPHRMQTIKEYGTHWKKTLAKVLKKTNFDVSRSLNVLGIEMQQNYKEMLISGKFVKNSPITLENRKKRGSYSTIPLYDTGEMYRALTYKVSKND